MISWSLLLQLPRLQEAKENISNVSQSMKLVLVSQIQILLGPNSETGLKMTEEIFGPEMKKTKRMNSKSFLELSG